MQELFMGICTVPPAYASSSPGREISNLYHGVVTEVYLTECL